MTTVPSLLSADQIVNYGIGTDLLNEFMREDKIAIKKDGDHYYTNKTVSPSYTQSDWNSLCEEYQYLYGDSVFRSGNFWGQSVEMIKENSSKTHTHNLGELNYNVPDASTPYDQVDGDYIFTGNALNDDDGNEHIVKLKVPASGVFNNVSKSGDYQILSSQSIIPGQETTIDATKTYDAAYSTTITRSFGIDASIKYKLTSTIGADEAGVKESVEESVEESFEFDLSGSDEQSSSGDTSVTVSSTASFTNNTDESIVLMTVVPTNHSSSQFQIEGKLYSVDNLNTADDQSVVMYYRQTNGQKDYKYRDPVHYIDDVLTSAQNAMRSASNAQFLEEGNCDISGGSHDSSLSTLADNIDPSTGTILTTGSFTSSAPDENETYFWMYNQDANCYASTFEKAADGATNECECDRNEEAGLSVDEDCSTSDDSIPRRSARNQELEFEPKLFTLSSLKNMHKIQPRVKDTISMNIGGKSIDAVVGSMADTYHRAYAIGGDAHDWHTNQVKGEHGGSILHQGADHYFGNTGSDFVSSKSVAGSSSIRTKGGDDTVLIDAKMFKKFTPGRTYLGKGNDTFFYRGSKKTLDELDARHENLFTGKGKDTIIVKNNPRLNVEDFDLEKDTLRMNFNQYETRINDHTIVFTSNEGGSVILRDVLNGFTGSYDSLPFA